MERVTGYEPVNSGLGGLAFQIAIEFFIKKLYTEITLMEALSPRWNLVAFSCSVSINLATQEQHLW